MKAIIEIEPLAKIDYVEIVGGHSIEKIAAIQGPVLAQAAIFIGKVRLIDNFTCEI
jgi:pantoate--beta-alanine ligase